MTFRLGTRGTLLLLASMASLCSAGPPNCSITAPAEFVSLTHRSAYPVRSTAGSLRPLYNFAHSFLASVQPNAFPLGIIQRVVDNEGLDTTEVAGYEAGYVVCLILAIVYMILVPALGGIFTWRHFRGNTGGSTLSSLSSHRHWGIAVATCLGATTILILVGVILAFTTNDRTRESMTPSLHNLRSNLEDMEYAVKSIPGKVDRIVETFSIPKAEIEEDLNGFGDDMGQAVIASSDTELEEALSKLSVSVQDAVGARESLQAVDTLRSRMQERQTQLIDQLALLRQGLQESSVLCPNCGLPSPDQLRTYTDYNQIPQVQPVLGRFPPAAEFTGLVGQASSSINGIPRIFEDQTAPSVKALMRALEDTRKSINDSSREFPSFQSVSDAVSDVRRTFSVYEEDIDRYDYQRWAVAVTFCTLILFIGVLTAVGLTLGLPALWGPDFCNTSALWGPDFCYAHDQDQLERIAVALLRVAVLMTLIFSWLFIILVIITLFFGGNVHTLGCRSWKNGEIFEFFDQNNDLFSSLNFSQPDISSMNLSTAEIYFDCKNGQSLFHSMKISQMFDMEDFLNISKYMAGFRQHIDSISVNLQNFQLLSSDGRRIIQSFMFSGIDRIDYVGFDILLSRPVMQTDLTALAEQLDTAAQTQTTESIRTDLMSKANEAREVNKLAQQQEQDAEMMNTSVNALSVISDNFKANIDKALESIGLLQQRLRQTVPSAVRNVSQCMLHKGEIYMDRYLNWARHTIINEILDCRWLRITLDNVYTSSCENVIDPWNGFWLCLGWCCVFLIPAVIFSLLLADHLQPVKSHLPSGKEDATSEPEKKRGKTEPDHFATVMKIMNIID